MEKLLALISSTFAIVAVRIFVSLLFVAVQLYVLRAFLRIIRSLGIRRQHLLQKLLGFLVLAHGSVGLCQARQTFQRRGIDSQPVRVRISRLREPRIQARRISHQKPQLRIIRCSLGCALGKFERANLIAVLQSLFRRPP